MTRQAIKSYVIDPALTNDSHTIDRVQSNRPINRMRIISVCMVNHVRFNRLSGPRFRSRQFSNERMLVTPAGTTRWINVEIQLRTTSRSDFNYISTLFQRQIPVGRRIASVWS